MKVDVAVIGAGISGLATAYELSRRGHRVVVFERQVHVGGNAVSEPIAGFLMEHGPSSVNATSPMATVWSRELGLEDQRVELGPNVLRRYLTAQDRLYGVSTHALGFLTSGYLSWCARFRMAAEYGIRRGQTNGEETVAEFCRRRFGSEFVERVMDPLVGGMFGGDVTRLAIAQVFPALVEMEHRHGSVIRGLVHRRLRAGKMPGKRLFSWRDGIAALSRTLAAGLGPFVKTAVTVRRIKALGHGFRVEAGANGTCDASAVVIATQPHVTARLLENVDPKAAEAAAAIEAPPLAVVFLGYQRRQVAHPLDGIGYLSPSAERRALTGALFCSTMFEGRAPQGHVAVAGYIGGARAPRLAELPPEDLVELARSEFGDLLGAKGQPVVARVRQWPRGLPQYTIGHGARAAVLKRTGETTPGLYLTGNYLNGVSVASCLERASETATGVDRFLVGVRGNGQSTRRPFGSSSETDDSATISFPGRSRVDNLLKGHI